MDPEKNLPAQYRKSTFVKGLAGKAQRASAIARRNREELGSPVRRLKEGGGAVGGAMAAAAMDELLPEVPIPGTSVKVAPSLVAAPLVAAYSVGAGSVTGAGASIGMVIPHIYNGTRAAVKRAKVRFATT